MLSMNAIGTKLMKNKAQYLYDTTTNDKSTTLEAVPDNLD